VEVQQRTLVFFSLSVDRVNAATWLGLRSLLVRVANLVSFPSSPSLLALFLFLLIFFFSSFEAKSHCVLMTSFQGGPFFELLSTQGKNPLEKWKVTPAKDCKREFDKNLKSYVYSLEGSTSLMQIPNDEKKACEWSFWEGFFPFLD
jgi:hypothetical protein